MLPGKLAKAERGELAIPLPVGCARRPSGEAAFGPDEQAQHVVRLVFSTFSRPETLSAVLTNLAPGEWSVPDLSAEPGMPTASIYNWIYRGWITARHAPRQQELDHHRRRRAAQVAFQCSPAGRKEHFSYSVLRSARLPPPPPGPAVTLVLQFL